KACAQATSASACVNRRLRAPEAPKPMRWPPARSREPVSDSRELVMNDMAKNLLLWVVIAIVLIVVFQTFNPRTETQNISYTDFLTQVENNTVKQVTISATIPATITGKRT